MSFTCLRTIRGLFTEIPSWLGRDGIRIPESGMVARTFRSGRLSESAGTEVMGGAGIIGDLTGATDTEFTTTTGITLGATRFITGTTSTGREATAEDST